MGGRLITGSVLSTRTSSRDLAPWGRPVGPRVLGGCGTYLRARRFPRLKSNEAPGACRRNPKGSAMYSIFYIIGVIVVILAVLQLIA
jgi:hypothetical protein